MRVCVGGLCALLTLAGLRRGGPPIPRRSAGRGGPVNADFRYICARVPGKTACVRSLSSLVIVYIL